MQIYLFLDLAIIEIREKVVSSLLTFLNTDIQRNYESLFEKKFFRFQLYKMIKNLHYKNGQNFMLIEEMGFTKETKITS